MQLKRSILIFPVACAVLYVFWALISINGNIAGVSGDDAIYLTSGRALVTTGEYRIPCLLGAPLNGKYPPLFSAILGLASLIFPPIPTSLIAFKVLSILLCAPGVFLFAYWLLRQSPERADPQGKPWLLLVLATNAALVCFTRELMSEGLYFSLSMAVVCTIGGFDRDRERLSSARWITACLLAVAAFYTRSMGIVLLAALPIFAWTHGHRRHAAVAAAVAAACLFPWYWWSHIFVPAHEPMAGVLPYFVSYDYHSKGLFALLRNPDVGPLAWLWRNLVYLLFAARACILPTAGLLENDGLRGAAAGPLEFLALGVLILAFARRSRPWSFASVYVLLSLLLVWLWPWPAKTRLLVPLAPFLLVAAWESMQALCRRMGQRRTVIPGILMFTLLAFNIVAMFSTNVLSGTLANRYWYSNATDASPSDALLSSVRWIEDNVPADAVLVTGPGGLMFSLYTGRQVCPHDFLFADPAVHLAHVYGFNYEKSGHPSFEQRMTRAQPQIQGRRLYQVYVALSNEEYAQCQSMRWDAMFSSGTGGGVLIREMTMPQ